MKHLVLALVCLSSMATADVIPDKPHIYVEGSASVEVVPDTMTFNVSISKVDESLAIAKRDVDARSLSLIETCKSIGISKESISSSALNVNPSTEYRDGNRIPNGTRVSRNIEIRLNDLDSYPRLMQALVDADISSTIDTRLGVDGETEYTDKAMLAALEDARSRGERIASALGRELGAAYSVSEFMTRGEERYALHVSRRVEGQLTAEIQASMVSAPGNGPFEPGVMAAKAQVYVVYLLK
jgi:uncharacterized protein